MDILPYAYQYGVGGVVLLVGLVFGVRGGFVGLRSGPPRRNLILVLGGLAFFMFLQGYLQFVAPGQPHSAEPYSGVSLERKSYGTGLDYGIIVGYFLVILALGSWFGRHNKNTKDFFFGGQRFSWWFIAMSMIATTVGSYSFVKYSRIAFKYGIASSQTYLNDWFWMPLFLFGWLPIVYFSRITSIPEYFERRFGKTARLAVTSLLLVYLIGYVGVNLFTMGKTLHVLVGWPIWGAAALVATVSAIYVTWGGQTSVIVTDLFQGFMLLTAGALLLLLGMAAVGGAGAFWEYLPPSFRMSFTNFNTDPSYSSVGVFWQDGMANSAVFYFLNQGVMMRFLSARSLNEGKKAAIAAMLILMPVAAVVVASGGWAGRAMVSAGLIPPDTDPASVFVVVSNVLCSPGVFGLVMAALTAALMSTVDTLVTAVSAIVVNDVWRPYVRPGRPDRYYLGIARWSAVGVTVLGVALVPLFMAFDSIYSAHGAFTAAVTPPLVVAVIFAVFWPRYTPAAASATVIGGFGLVVLSVFIPELVAPFSHGIPRVGEDGELLEYARAYKFTRALYGLAVSAAIGIVVTWFTKPKPDADLSGLVWNRIREAVRAFKGDDADPFAAPTRARLAVGEAEADDFDEETGRARVRLTTAAREALCAAPGDLLHVADTRWWFGGLRSGHAVVMAEVADGDEARIDLGPEMRAMTAARKPIVVVERIL